MRKLFIFVRVYWAKIVLIALLASIVFGIISLLTVGLSTFVTMESFMRKQMLSMMGMYLVIGIIQAFVFVAFIQGANYFMMSGGLFGRIGREKASTAKTDVTWTDVIGMESAKEEAWELVKLLKDASLIKSIGGKVIKGTLMIGPPGCGKTYLAKAIATECGLPMLSVSGSDFVGIFVGQGAAQIKSLFRQAREQAHIHGGCLIFIDEIDSFARPRMADTGFGGGISHNATINQFLTEMDGLRKKENNIVVIAATNMNEGELDPAIVRAGRFDRKIYITKPNLKERKEIFDFYLKKVTADPAVNSDVLSRRTVYFSPSDIDAMIREAGIIALRNSRATITMKDLSEAYDRISYGNKSNIRMTPEDKKWTAYHEAGHAIIACLHPRDDVVKASIIPRRGFLGFVAHQPGIEYYSKNREHLLAEIKIALASYAAEEVTFGSTTTGVGGGPNSDFHHAMATARAMVWSYGMGPSGYLGDFQNYLGPYGQVHISDPIKVRLEEDVQQILRTCMDDVRTFLRSHKDLLDTFAAELLAKEELEYDEIKAIFERFGLRSAAESAEKL